MEINEIENKIACNELSAAQVFTQMKQHIDTRASISIEEHEKLMKEQREEVIELIGDFVEVDITVSAGNAIIHAIKAAFGDSNEYKSAFYRR